MKIEPLFEPGVAIPLFQTNVTGFIPYDVSPEGRFLLNTIAETAPSAASHAVVLLNWQHAVRR